MVKVGGNSQRDRTRAGRAERRRRGVDARLRQPCAKQAIASADGDGKTFAGQADDPFFLDLRVFDLLYGGDLSEVGDDTLAGFNVNTLGAAGARRRRSDGPNDDPVVGVWSARPQTRTDVTATCRHRCRAWASPLVNEVVIPLKDKNKFNASEPGGRRRQFLAVRHQPRAAEAHRGCLRHPGARPTPRDDLVSVFLTGVNGLNQPTQPRLAPGEMLRLNMSIPPRRKPNRLGVIGGDNARLPERSPADRRRGRHLAAGRRRRAGRITERPG